MSIVRRCVVARGRVQGVWFRESARRRATELGVSGWVRNAPAELEGGAEAVDVLVLSRMRGGCMEEERVARDGRVLTADLNGATLTAVRTTRERVERVRGGEDVPPTGEEERARTLWLAPEEGFRIFKPGVAWIFVPPEGRESAVRVAVRDVTGTAVVSVRA